MKKALGVLALVLVAAHALAGNSEHVMLIDDFSAPDGRSALGRSWEGFSDRVMGGRSDMQSGYRQVDGGNVLFLRGRVRLDNNGGFIQVRLPLAERGGRFDAGGFRALRLEARAVRPGAYYVHLRSVDTRRPWAYYRARLNATDEWSQIELPWAEFEPRNLDRPLATSSLRAIAIVAYGEAFDADIEIRRVELVND